MTPAGPETLAVLVTEAELDVLEQAHLRGADPSSAPGTGAEEVPTDPGAIEEAGRSLRLRGLLRPDGLVRDDGELGGLLTMLLDVRFVAGRVLFVHRAETGSGTWEEPAGEEAWGGLDDDVRLSDRFVHLAGGCACVEDVLPDGSRCLRLELDPDRVPAWVTDLAVPEGAEPGTGPPLTVPPDRADELAGLLRGPSVYATLQALVRPADGGEPLVESTDLVALGPRGCWAGRPAGPGGPSTLELRPVAPDWVEGWVRAQQALVSGQGTMSG